MGASCRAWVAYSIEAANWDVCSFCAAHRAERDGYVAVTAPRDELAGFNTNNIRPSTGAFP